MRLTEVLFALSPVICGAVGALVFLIGWAIIGPSRRERERRRSKADDDAV